MNKAEIQQMQDRYNQLVALLPELEQGLEQWKKATELLAPLRNFYHSPEWQALHDTFDEPLDTKGNYSILSEDALWDLLGEHHRLAIEWLKLSTATITQD